jgi:hypothetical protein
MDFSTKLAQTRTYTQDNQLGVDSQEVYNEAILQAVETTNPTSNTQEVITNVLTESFATMASVFYSVSFIFSSDFSGTMQENTIEPNTIINLTAKTTLDSIGIVITTGSVTIVGIYN